MSSASTASTVASQTHNGGRAIDGEKRDATVARSVLPVLLDWPRDEAAHDGLPWEIWWVTAILDTGDRRVAAHLLAVRLLGGAMSVSVNLTDLDGNTEMAASNRYLAPGEVRVSTDTLSIETDEVAFYGSFEDGYRLRAELGDDCGFDLRLAPGMPVLFNGGGGQHLFQGVTTNQYSLGGLRVTGEVRVGGEPATATGHGWYDRQWERTARDVPLSFTWFGLCLEDSDVLSVFDDGNGSDTCGWGTVVRRDGTHVVAAVRVAGSDRRPSRLGRDVAERWRIEVPAMDAVLDASHRTIADAALIHTGVMEVTGRYGGRQVRGHGFCDIVGPIADARAAS